MARAKEAQTADFPTGIPECGADALRFGLLAYTVQGRDVNLDIKRIVGYRQFCNKIWNAVKFGLSYLDDFATSAIQHNEIPVMKGISKRDLYILHQLNETIKSVNEGFEEFNFGAITTSLHSFFIYELCDVYIELLKPVFNADKSGTDEDNNVRSCAQAVLYTVLEWYLRLCHPVMPFITEELWQRLPDGPIRSNQSIMIAPYPIYVPEWFNEDVIDDMTILKNAISGARSLRSMYKVGNHVKIDFYYITSSEKITSALTEQGDDFCTLAKANSILKAPDVIPKRWCNKVISDQLSILANLSDIIDVDKEIARLEKDINKISPLLQSLQNKINSSGYEKVPENVRKSNNDKLIAYQTEIHKLETALENFSL